MSPKINLFKIYFTIRIRVLNIWKLVDIKNKVKHPILDSVMGNVLWLNIDDLFGRVKVACGCWLHQIKG